MGMLYTSRFEILLLSNLGRNLLARPRKIYHNNNNNIDFIFTESYMKVPKSRREGVGGEGCINPISSPNFPQIPFHRIEFGCWVLSASWILFPLDLSSTSHQLEVLVYVKIRYVLVAIFVLSLERPSVNWAGQRSSANNGELCYKGPLAFWQKLFFALLPQGNECLDKATGQGEGQCFIF